MRKVSKETAEVEDVGVLLDRSGELDDYYSVNFRTFPESIDGRRC